MEDKRSLRSGFFDVDDIAASSARSPAFYTAALSVLVLALAVLWSIQKHVEANSLVAIVSPTSTTSLPVVNLPHTASEQNPRPIDLSDFAPQVVGLLASNYAQMQQHGTYSASAAANAAQQLAPTIKAPVSYKTYSIADITTTPDTLYARMKTYQKDMQAALAPLAKNTTPEISLFSAYAQTKDTAYLDHLRIVVQAYEASVAAAAKIEVPQEAISYHISMLNAMGEFAATLSALADNASDPLTTLALLNTYNDAEYALAMASNAFAGYVSNHKTL